MVRLTGLTVDHTFFAACSILDCAQITAPRGMEVKEIIDPTLVIHNPEFCIIDNPVRKLSIKYLAAELLWYFSGDTTNKEIGKHASLWNTIADPDGRVNSNYGHYIWFQPIPDRFIHNQFEWVVNSLQKDMYSRQAIINFNQPQHKYHTKDFVCTISMQFFIRDNKLIAITNMRSNDLIYGFGYDVPFFCAIQQLVYYALLPTYPNLKLGFYSHHAASLHVYKRHFDMVHKIVSDQKLYFSPKSNSLNITKEDFPNILDDIMERRIYTDNFKSAFIHWLRTVRDSE